MSHHHNHDSDHHHHHHESGDTLPVDQKMIKLVAHWIRHNEDHEANYREWAQKATDEGMADVAAALAAAAQLTKDTTAAFKRALTLLETR